MIQLVNFILCGATFLLTFLIFVNTNKVNVKANLWFGTFVFCIFLLFLETVISDTKLLNENNLVFDLLSISSFIIAPVFYLSVSYYVEPVKKWAKTDFFHFGFAAFILSLMVLSHFIDDKVDVKDVDPETIKTATLIFNICFSLQVVPYCILAYIKIIGHQKNIQLISSTVENVDLKWLKHIIICVFVIALFWILDITFNLSEKSYVFDSISSLVYLFGIFYITFYWLKQKEIFPYNLADKAEIETILVETTIPNEKRKKLLSDVELSRHKSELEELLLSKKPFLNSELSLVKLADLLNVSTHLLSYVINNGFDENFYQFINRYRIEEAKKLILDPKMNYLTLLGIGFEVGFNSKTVFNTTFKKITGQTPSEFKNQNKK